MGSDNLCNEPSTVCEKKSLDIVRPVAYSLPGERSTCNDTGPGEKHQTPLPGF